MAVRPAVAQSRTIGMGSPRVSSRLAQFGERPLRPDELETVLAAGIDLGRSTQPTVATASLAIARELMSVESSSRLFVYCRLNRDEVAAHLVDLRDRFALPLRIDAATAEVLSQTLDAMRTPHEAARQAAFGCLRRRCSQVVRTFVDECRGFVPAISSEQHADSLASAIADWIELPKELSLIAAAAFGGATAEVVAAQIVLEFSQRDRRQLLGLAGRGAVAHSRVHAGSVADLLSRHSSLDRFRVEVAHVAAWVRACAVPPESTTCRSRP